ncbi:hypothetical protein F2Q70_00042553 [Brassica cretica]|uniref:Ubiquitin-like protease family profile domain-containing protein n=1 Tax=Brassica cretica TaxID=69181 RepID=A0A8S9KHS1_BRACR|nr:hypothetical protein F2Q70_00042553 [Brassica cretica]
MEFPKPVEAVGKVAPPKAGGEASVKEINAELQGTEDEERYDSCKDDMSTDSQIQENPRDLCGETDADSEDVGSGGKRHRMRSSKISGVYTPDPRVKKLFKSEEKVEYKPIAKTDRTQFKKFAEILRENPEQMWDIATGHSVCNHFFLEIVERGKWMFDEHMHVIMNMLRRRRGIYLQKERMVILDQYFIKTIQSNWSAFSADNDKLQFEWGKNVAKYVTGKSKGQKMKLGLGRDVDTVYIPMNWGGDHWVGLCIKLTEGHVTVFDSYVPHTEIEGQKIHASCRRSLMYRVQRDLPVGEWRVVENFKISGTGGQYRPTKLQYKMTILGDTTISRTDYRNDNHFLSLARYEEIGTKNLKTYFLIDILGQVVDLGRIMTVEVKGEERKRVLFCLRDTSGNEVAFCLWGQYAEQIESHIAESKDDTIICLIRFAKISEFRGELQITNAYDASLLMLNPKWRKLLILNRSVDSVSNLFQITPQQRSSVSALSSQDLRSTEINPVHFPNQCLQRKNKRRILDDITNIYQTPISNNSNARDHLCTSTPKTPSIKRRCVLGVSSASNLTKNTPEPRSCLTAFASQDLRSTEKENTHVPNQRKQRSSKTSVGNDITNVDETFTYHTVETSENTSDQIGVDHTEYDEEEMADCDVNIEGIIEEIDAELEFDVSSQESTDSENDDVELDVSIGEIKNHCAKEVSRKIKPLTTSSKCKSKGTRLI